MSALRLRATTGLDPSWRLGSGQTAQYGICLSDRFGRLSRFAWFTFREVGTNNDFGHHAIGAQRQAISDAGIHVEATNLKIDHGVNVVLLLVEGQGNSAAVRDRYNTQRRPTAFR